MNPQINRDIDRPTETLIDSFTAFGSADVHEAMEKAGGMAPAIKRVTGTTVCGPATTVQLPTGDNMMVHAALKLAEPGDVIVAESNTTRAAVWGELTTRQAQHWNVAGIVTNGNVRDIDTVSDLGFPMFARAASQIGAVKETPGAVNTPISLGGVIVHPGDIVLGDGDGVTVVPQSDAAAVLEATRERVTREDDLRTRIDRGERLYDIAGYEETLQAHGLSVNSGTD